MIAHLLHIGYPKTGSTFLQRWFDRHPRIAFNRWGIAGASDTMRLTETFAYSDGLDCAVTSFEGFVAPVRDYRNIDDEVAARLVPCQADLVRLAERLASVFPNATVLIVTRGLREIIGSYYGEAVRQGCVVSMDEFCRRFVIRQDPEEVPISYDFIIGLYERLFGADRVIVLPYELLRRDAERFVRTIEEAVGISHRDLPLEVVYPSLSAAELNWYRGLGRLLASLPVGALARAGLLRLHRKLVRGNGLARIIAVAEWAGKTGPTEEVPGQVIEALRGSSTCLKGRPFYEDLEAEYLL